MPLDIELAIIIIFLLQAFIDRNILTPCSTIIHTGVSYIKKHWGETELSEQWSLNAEEHDVIVFHPGKRSINPILASSVDYEILSGHSS